MAYRRKTWQEKLHNGLSAKVEVTDKKFADIPEQATMLIPTPEIVDEYVRNIPYGTAGSLAQMRKDLAPEYNAQFTCPVTSGIFLRVAAEAAYEEYQQGKSIDAITPFWRMMDRKSAAVKKLTFGADFVRDQRLAEGLSF